MIKLLAYLMKNGVATSRRPGTVLPIGSRGLPLISGTPCVSDECTICASACPTDAIEVTSGGDGGRVSLDLGACIGCGLCVDTCPSDAIVCDGTTNTVRLAREQMILRGNGPSRPDAQSPAGGPGMFGKSLAVRVVSTGCSACDLEVSAAGNPIFDMERFGIHVVASPRFADVLLVTGPVPKAMHEPLLRCYEAMAEPRLVVAVGTCAISGGVHRGGYAEANGADKIVPVDAYIPGCPPHPWSIINGLQAVRRLHGGKGW